MMRTSSRKILVAVVVALVLMASGAFADCPLHHHHHSTAAAGWSGYVSTGYMASGPCATCAAYEARAVRHEANCLFDEIRADHRQIKAHLAGIEKGPVADRGTHWAELRAVLLPHMQGEERVLYPALEASGSSIAKERGMVGAEEHAAAACVFQKLDGGDMTSDRWYARFIVFKDMVERHMSWEQDRLFATARRALSGDQLIAMCSAFMNERRLAAANLPSPMQPASYRTGASSSAAMPISPIHGQCLGFDNLSTSNMTMRCPSCGTVVGTVTPVSSETVVYGKTAAPETTTSQTQAATTQPAAADNANQAPAQPMPSDMQMGTMQCPNCGAAMGSVCPYSATGATMNGAAGAGMAPMGGTGNETPTSTGGQTNTSSGGNTRY